MAILQFHGSILQAETSQIPSLAENQRCSQCGNARTGTSHMKMCSDVDNMVGTLHIEMYLDVHTRIGTPHMKMDRVGTPHIKMCSGVQTRVGTPHRGGNNLGGDTAQH